MGISFKTFVRCISFGFIVRSELNNPLRDALNFNL
jgi:hypothetical protein